MHKKNIFIRHNNGQVILLGAKRVRLIGYSTVGERENWIFCVDGRHWSLSFDVEYVNHCIFVQHGSCFSNKTICKHLNVIIPHYIVDFFNKLKKKYENMVPRIGDGDIICNIIIEEDIYRHNKIVQRLSRKR